VGERLLAGTWTRGVWGEVLSADTVVVAVMSNHLVHHADVIALKGSTLGSC